MQERLDAMFEKLQDLLADMTPRDRRLLLGVVIFLAVAFTGGVGFVMNRSLKTMQGRIADRAKNLEFVYEMAQDYVDAEAELKGLERKLERSSSVDLSAFLEQACQAAGIDSPDSVRETESVTEGGIEEKIYQVQLKSLSTQQLAEFLYEAETKDYPLRIRSAKVKTRKRKGEITLNLDMDVSAFATVGGEG